MTDEQPSKVRYLIVAAATLMAFLLYLDRFCVSFAVDYIRQDLDLSQEQISWFLSAFFWSYALAQVPSGWLSDRYGARIMLCIYILTWSLFTGLIGASTTFFMLLATRLATGLGQAGAYPTAASVVGRWVPLTARGTASAMVANGGRVGGALAPVLTAFLIVAFVPQDTPVELNESDVISVEELIETLQPEGKTAELWERLSTGERKRLTEMRDGYTDGGAEGGQSTFTEDAAFVVTVLNRALDSDSLHEVVIAEDLKLPREGFVLLERQTDGESISEVQRRRFNRFVLEALFPNSIKKLYGRGWRPVLYVYGAAGILVAAFFWYFFRERPEVHPWSNGAEHALILRGREETAKHAGKQIGAAPVKELVLSGNMWCCCIMQWGTNIGWLFLMTWLPRYLLEVHQVPILERATMTMIPPLIGMIGMFCGGAMTDILGAKLGVKWGRRLPISCSRLTAILAYLGCIGVSTLPAGHSLNTPWVFVGLFAVVAFSTDFGAAPTWAFSQDVGGRQVGSVLGWGNMWGNLGAAVAPPIYNHFLGENPTLENWNTMFGVCAASFTVSAICALIIDASKPIAPEAD
ncbi:MAG: MFS transporter [Planctomycetota bacterium]